MKCSRFLENSVDVEKMRTVTFPSKSAKMRMSLLWYFGKVLMTVLRVGVINLETLNSDLGTLQITFMSV